MSVAQSAFARSADQESVFARRRRLHQFIRNGHLGPDVTNELLPQSGPHLYEKQLWDYKLDLSSLPSDRRPSDAEKQDYEIKMADIVKDAIAFYNSYGGYLVVGVRNQPREIVGFERFFDVGELNKKITAVTKHEVDCHFSLVSYPAASRVSIGLLFIPQRPDSKEPAQCLRDAPTTSDGKRAYKKQDIYFRQGDACRPAQTSDDYSFLCSPGRRHFGTGAEIGITSVRANNLGPRDPGFIRFVGREEYLHELWRWLCDKYSPCKLLAGLGGVGKTTIAREFAEDITRNAPLGFEAVIWLSAKKLHYVAVLGKHKLATRVDFTDVDSMLRALLLELASTKEMLDPDWSTEELMEQAIEALRLIPGFIVIDDVDTLEPKQQHAVFHAILQITGQTIGTAPVASRALLTARLDLGASPSRCNQEPGS